MTDVPSGLQASAQEITKKKKKNVFLYNTESGNMNSLVGVRKELRTGRFGRVHIFPHDAFLPFRYTDETRRDSVVDKTDSKETAALLCNTSLPTTRSERTASIFRV
jgi:hypothetical protein